MYRRQQQSTPSSTAETERPHQQRPQQIVSIDNPTYYEMAETEFNGAANEAYQYTEFMPVSKLMEHQSREEAVAMQQFDRYNGH